MYVYMHVRMYTHTHLWAHIHTFHGFKTNISHVQIYVCMHCIYARIPTSEHTSTLSMVLRPHSHVCVCMYVCMYMHCIYAHMPTSEHTSTVSMVLKPHFSCMYVCMYVCMYALHICTHTHLWAHVHSFHGSKTTFLKISSIFASAKLYVCMYVFIYVCVCMYVYMYVCKFQVCTYVCMHAYTFGSMHDFCFR